MMFTVRNAMVLHHYIWLLIMASHDEIRVLVSEFQADMEVMQIKKYWWYTDCIKAA